MNAPLASELFASSSTFKPISRPVVRGKFIFAGEQKIYIRGVTYGTFSPAADGHQYPARETVARDFAEMAANSINAVRTYTVPPRWLLDLAHEHRLWVMVGLPWEQHITFLDNPRRTRAIEHRVRAGVKACAAHPAVLCYAVGNEIPSPIVRWHGARRVERFIKRLYRTVKSEDPHAIVTYVNYPTTEYLNLGFLDFLCFNVFLENRTGLEAYLARLQNIAGDKPLLLAEIGLDSRRNGEELQAETLAWQIDAAFSSGCAGAFLFSWTDEWFRGGFDIEDWDFGLTRRDRAPKRALETVSKVFAQLPFATNSEWPRISVVVCSYNGARTIRDCFKGLRDLQYPNYEVIVVNDGSKDRTAAITHEYGFRLINTENRGLSSARNTGAQAATGEIVAYIDDDAYPDPHWLTYLASTFMTTSYAAVGGPNIAPPGDGAIAECVAHAPGGPVHVLLNDRDAEHIPGCNMAFRKSALMEIGGFDPRFRTAGDDVDVCWRIQDQGWKIGFNPAAMVWHHRRNSLRAYWKQQKGYGKAEALLEAKWPEKYNGGGHVTWGGRIYGNGLTRALGFRRPRIYQGSWGSAPFQSVCEPASNSFTSLLLVPEWYLLMFALAVVGALGFLWKPLFLALPLMLGALTTVVIQAIQSAQRERLTEQRRRAHRIFSFGLIAVLHLVQPLARLFGRLRFGLTMWRRRGHASMSWPYSREIALWSEHWRSATWWLENCEEKLRAQGSVVRRGGDLDTWDLEVRSALFSRVRIRSAVEEHGAGKQLVRFRILPTWSLMHWAVPIMLISVAVAAALNQAPAVSIIIGLLAALLAARIFQESAVATGVALRALRLMKEGLEEHVLSQPEISIPSTVSEVVQAPSIARGAHAIPRAAAFTQASVERKENIRAHPKPLAAAAAAGQNSSG
jgi:GT2 family glycosyltransferase